MFAERRHGLLQFLVPLTKSIEFLVGDGGSGSGRRGGYRCGLDGGNEAEIGGTARQQPGYTWSDQTVFVDHARA